jgi:hypothetical protein
VQLVQLETLVQPVQLDLLEQPETLVQRAIRVQPAQRAQLAQLDQW